MTSKNLNSQNTKTKTLPRIWAKTRNPIFLHNKTFISKRNLIFKLKQQ